MAKTKVSEFDAVASNNTDINSVNVAEGCPPSGINNAIREMASLLKKQEVGTDAMTSPDINGGTIDGATIGGSSGVTIGVSDGTVSAPSIKFTSDTNTGIYRGGTDILKFVTAGTDAITIASNQSTTLAGNLNVSKVNANTTLDGTTGYSLLKIKGDSTLRIDFGTSADDDAGRIQYDTSSNEMRFFTNGTKRMDIDSGGDFQLYEDTGSTPKLFWDASAEVLTSNVGGYWRLQPSGSEASPAYSFEGDTDTGMFRPSGNANTVAISTGGTEAMRIDSSQNLLVGKTAEDIGTAGHAFAAQGYAFHTRSGNTPLFINRLTNDGNLVEFRKDGTTVGSIGATSGVLTIDGEGANTGGFYFNGANNILPRKNKAFNTGTIDLGADSQRWKDLYLSGGVVFGDAGGSGTSTSNTLDSYEEGTWTPAISTTTGSITMNSSFSGGSYTKIGDTVIAWAKIRPLSQSSPTGGLDITGLPFTAQSGSGTNAGGFGQGIVQGSYSSDPNIVLAQVYAGTTDIRLRRRNGATSTDDMATYLVDGNYYSFTVIYKI
jgi:hypothetical protein